MDLDKFDAVCSDILIRAGKIAKDSPMENFSSETKGMSEYEKEKIAKSSVDLLIQNIIIEGLTEEINNGLKIFAEESLAKSDFPVEGYKLIIDPVDGTLNMHKGSPHWGISVVLLNGADPVYGMIHYPELNITLKTQKGKGTYINKKKIELEKKDYEENHFVRVSGALGDISKGMREQFPKEERSSGSYSVTLLHLLNNSVHNGIPNYKAYIGGSTPVWDLGCATLAWREAGGIIVDLKNQEINPFEFIINDMGNLKINTTFILAHHESQALKIIEKIKPFLNMDGI